MSLRFSKVLAALVFVALILLLIWHLKSTATGSSNSAVVATPEAKHSDSVPRQEVPQLPARDPSAVPSVVFQLNSPSSTIAADLQIISDVLETFRTNFPALGNPVGENSEITTVLTGGNPLHLAFIPRNHPAIDSHGALCDRWSTPFFFHQLSSSQMEIRSAGPDRKLWTSDDVVLTP